MTKISEVHGIPMNEFADRGKQIKAVSYVPYLSLTTGEMRLQLAAQRARVLSEWYGNDAPQYAEAEKMLNRALYAGVHAGGALSIGTISDNLQPVARLIKRAQYQTAPASGSLFVRSQGITSGIGAIIPAKERLLECLKNAKNELERTRCMGRATVENIINTRIEGCSHHMLYKNLQAAGVPTQVSIHRGYHRLGVEGLANVASLKQYDLMYEWVENGILASNAKGGVGPLGSVKSSFHLAPDPEKYLTEFKISGAHIGFEPTIAAALVALIVSAIGVAQKILTDLQKVDYRALVEARGFGTPEFSASKNDWNVGPGNEITKDNTLLLLLLAGGVYLATQEN